MGAAVKLKMTAVPRQQGERARLKVVRGPDYGVTFVITGGRATLGRGEENDVVVSDLKASRQHAEIAWSPGGWMLRDLGSANGILHNGKAVRSATLAPKDTVSIGETIFEFGTAEQPTVMLAAPPRSPEQVRAEEIAYDEQKKKVRALGFFGAGTNSGAGTNGGGGAAGAALPSMGGGPVARKDSKRFLVLGVIAVGVALLLFEGEQGAQKPKAKPKAKGVAGSDLEKYLPAGDPPAQTRSAELFFKMGFREYTQGNYLRAKTQFETALQIAPSHPMASLYLQNSETRIKEAVENHLRTGKKSLDAGKLREARAHFEQTLRLLHRDQTNPHYIEAREQLEAVLKLIKGETEGPA